MFKPLGLFVGFRYLKNRQTGGFSAFISASSTVGIALGVLVLITVLSAMNGFERALSQHLLSSVPHGELMGVNEPYRQWTHYASQMSQHPQVISVAPVIKLHGMLQEKNALKGVEVRGVEPGIEKSVSNIPNLITHGSWDALRQENTTVLGEGVATALNVVVGDSIQLLLPPPDNSLARQFAAPIKRKLTVVGIFDFADLDKHQAYISLASAQQIQKYREDQVDGIRFKVSNVFAAPLIIREVAMQSDHYTAIYDWTHTHGHLYNDIQLVRMVMYIVLVLVIAVASFNIVSTLIMVVNEKKGDIAILKTMGASPVSILFVFVLQGLFNGVMGCFFGGTLGYLLASNLTEIVSSIEQFFNIQFLSGDVYFVDFLPTEVHNLDVVITISTALLLSLLATLYPAWQATRVEPAQVLGQS
ncbi:lipoprotein-releasing ABC transporter permease subunit LolE [Thalassotalea fusca]